MTEGEFHKRRNRRGRRSTSSKILKKMESNAQIVTLCAYELRRKDTMEKNERYMDTLGIKSNPMPKTSSIERKHSTNMGSVPEPEKRKQPDRACKSREPENSQSHSEHSESEREEEDDDEEIEVDDEEAEEYDSEHSESEREEEDDDDSSGDA